MRIVWILMALVLVATVWGCRAQEEPAADTSESDAPVEVVKADKALNLTGKLTVRVLKVDGPEAPENAFVQLELRHVVDPATRGTETVTRTSVPATEFPMDIVLPYEVSQIENREIYLVNVSIVRDQKLLHGTDVEVPVLTYGKGERTQVVVKPANIMRSQR